MRKAKIHYFIRRTHRWLGVTMGIQLLFWTVGGLYFSWSNMNEVHGDYEKAPLPLLATTNAYVSPTIILDSLRKKNPIDSLSEMKLVTILGQPTWQISYAPSGHEHHHYMVQLADAQTGQLRSPLSKEEAIQVAKNGYAGKGKMTEVEYINKASAHHEYREQPLPAYAVTFGDERKTIVYVSTALGTIQKYRNRPWRQFDFLWMLHTMDYSSRDNISNWILKAFSIFSLVTVVSGFTLFFVSRRRKS